MSTPAYCTSKDKQRLLAGSVKISRLLISVHHNVNYSPELIGRPVHQTARLLLRDVQSDSPRRALGPQSWHMKEKKLMEM